MKQLIAVCVRVGDVLPGEMHYSDCEYLVELEDGNVIRDRYPVKKLFNIEVEIPSYEEREQMLVDLSEDKKQKEIKELEERLRDLKAA